ncbi:Cyclin-like protein [Neofusicoccum parvum]|nr:Cyclin-like protein [Neofusicoccum parvum]
MFQANRLPRAVICSLALLGTGVSAQSSGSATVSESASSTTSSAVKTHTVLVGKADHKFEPDVTQALVGDIIKFQFYPTNHSVVRAEYGYPCIPYEMTGTGKTGFTAGFHPVDAILDDPPSFNIRVNDTDPIFFYCSAPGSCINYEMVGVINPNKSTSLETQKQKAGESSFMLNPGEKFPDEAASSSVVSGAAKATATATSTSTVAAAAGGSSSGGSSLSGGAIAGIVVGAVAVIGILAALFFYVGRNKSLKEKVNRQSATMSPQMGGSPPMFQSPVGLFPQSNPYFPRSNMGGGPPSYSPSGDEYSTVHTGTHPRSYFTEVGMYPHHNAMSDGQPYGNLALAAGTSRPLALVDPRRAFGSSIRDGQRSQLLRLLAPRGDLGRPHYTPPDYPPTFRPTQGKRQSSASVDPSQQSRAKRRETFADAEAATTEDPQEPQPRVTPQPATFSSAIQRDSASEEQEQQPQHNEAAAPPQPLDPNAKAMPVLYETCDVKDLGVLISDMLMELVRLNDGLPLQDGQLTRFHSRAPPSISVRDYLNRLIVHATLSPPILLSMVYYIDRLCLLYPAFTISSLTVHRFLIAAATVASKGLSDSFWTNNTYARVGGVSTRELALLELEFLTRLQWRIVPKPEVLVDYYRSLVERGEGYVMAQEQTQSPE